MTDEPAELEYVGLMASDEGQLIYRLRAAAAEWVNALAHNLDRTLAIRAGATG